MPTNQQSVEKYLDFALLQLGAESYLHALDFSIGSDVVERFKYGFKNKLKGPGSINF